MGVEARVGVAAAYLEGQQVSNSDSAEEPFPARPVVLPKLLAGHFSGCTFV